jgi:hypothetical protein
MLSAVSTGGVCAERIADLSDISKRITKRRSITSYVAHAIVHRTDNLFYVKNTDLVHEYNGDNSQEQSKGAYKQTGDLDYGHDFTRSL